MHYPPFEVDRDPHLVIAAQDRLAELDAVQPVWEKYGKQHADLIKRIQDVK